MQFFFLFLFFSFSPAVLVFLMALCISEGNEALVALARVRLGFLVVAKPCWRQVFTSFGFTRAKKYVDFGARLKGNVIVSLAGVVP